MGRRLTVSVSLEYTEVNEKKLHLCNFEFHFFRLFVNLCNGKIPIYNDDAMNVKENFDPARVVSFGWKIEENPPSKE